MKWAKNAPGCNLFFFFFFFCVNLQYNCSKAPHVPVSTEVICCAAKVTLKYGEFSLIIDWLMYTVLKKKRRRRKLHITLCILCSYVQHFYILVLYFAWLTVQNNLYLILDLVVVSQFIHFSKANHFCCLTLLMWICMIHILK